MNRRQLILSLVLAVGCVIARAGDTLPYSQGQFDTLSRQGKPVVVAVHASWCPTCKAQKPILNQLMHAPAYHAVTLLLIDFDRDKPLLTHYRVDMQSTLIAFKGGREMARTVGDTSPDGIERLVKASLP
ncbi:MAG: thioredoxin family protein [Paludibacterium sp.]|uniref:thioredoxin family protein n=1 Tax=Paludibacterium sp. TaxID=1917523 RepID=UPI0025D54819|nr:thioredoxin family protein [Paludibacterium sp.]MBV8048218.1 thioredoxin family protein [Paludibacterium sp.]MBV8645900.1 thioredoxin family protein [Paludibacterium sp.]